MRLLIDLNVLLDVPLARPGSAATAELLARCGTRYQALMAWHSLSTFAHLMQRELKAAAVRSMLGELLEWVEVVKTGHAEALAALALPMKDLEDALQVTAAQAGRADALITRNVRDFKNAPLPVFSPEAFLKAHP
jgi:predicted nucleic acid-binding protein